MPSLEKQVKAAENIWRVLKKEGKYVMCENTIQGLNKLNEMRKIAENRGLAVLDGIAENLPFESERFDLVLMVTTLCFLDDAKKAFSEVYRILRPGGYFINGFVDKNSRIGKLYQKYKERSTFYNIAVFYSAEEVIRLLEDTGFKEMEFRQTIFNTLNKITKSEILKEGYGEGSFIVIKSQK